MSFINDDFLLETEMAKRLYHEYAKSLPIIDYHNHLPIKQIAQNHQYENLSQLWLDGDHYKWRAMRTWGIDEKYITGKASDEEKFQKWAEVVPHTLRNPLYHWTHLELSRYFGINELLNISSADKIYGRSMELIQDGNHRVFNLLEKMNVKVLCTTDGPLDNLEYHKALSNTKCTFKVLPTFRPDVLIDTVNPKELQYIIQELSNTTGIRIVDFDSFLEAVNDRHTYFHNNGCRLADNGLNSIDFELYTSNEINAIFKKILAAEALSVLESKKYRSASLLEFSRMHHGRGWVQQFHLGALRNTNTRMLRTLGPDTGFDSIGDFPQAESLSRFFNALDEQDQLAKTIVYNLNPAQNEVFATMVGNYNDGSVKGKIQFGSGWWFLDQLDGMQKQINALSNMGLLSCFVGMLTDSRSFLSFPRHEYFRRLLCNIFGNDMKKGLIPDDMGHVGDIIKNICYNNAKDYFEF